MKSRLFNVIMTFTLVASLSFAGCGGTSGNKTDNATDEQTISPKGGTYTFDDGISLIVPDGAVNSDTPISIHKLQTSDISYVTNSGLTEWTTMAAFEGLPEGMTFLKPVTAILPVEAITDETIIPFHIKMNSGDNGFNFIPGDISYKHGETSISMEIDGFSDHGVVGLDPEAEIDAILSAAGIASGNTLSQSDEDKIISIMDSWIKSAVDGNITDGMGYADIQKVIDEYIRWRSALDELSAVIPNIDSQLGEQDTNARELCSQAIGSAQNNAVSACACGNDLSSNYSTLLAVQTDIDRLGWDDLNNFVMTQDYLTLACGSLEIDPSSADVAIDESKTLLVKVKDGAGIVKSVSSLSNLTWTNGNSSKVELTPGDMSASAKGLDKGNVIVSVSYQIVGDNIPEGCGLISADATVNVKDSTSSVPGNGGAYTFTYVNGHTLSLNWTAATDDTTQQSDLVYKAVYSTSANIGTVANAEANGTIKQDWTANITSVEVTASTYDQNTYYAVLVKDQAGNKAVYSQRVVPIVEIACEPVDGTYSNPVSEPGSYFIFRPGNIFNDNGTDYTYNYDLNTALLYRDTGSGNYENLNFIFIESSAIVFWQEDIFPVTSVNFDDISGSYTNADYANGTPVAYSASFNKNGNYSIVYSGSIDEWGTWSCNSDNSINLSLISIGNVNRKYLWVKNGSNWYFIHSMVVYFRQ